MQDGGMQDRTGSSPERDEGTAYLLRQFWVIRIVFPCLHMILQDSYSGSSMHSRFVNSGSGIVVFPVNHSWMDDAC